MAVNFPYLDVSNCNASVKVAQNGAQVFGFDRVGEAPVLWVSPSATYEMGRPLRGGMPICWPWFGAHPTDASLPRNGFARVMPWELEDFAETGKGVTASSFKLRDAEETRKIWPYRFELTLSVEVSRTLKVTLITKNLDEKPFEISQAISAYLFIGDIQGVEVEGLEGHEYVDRVSGETRVQNGPVVVKGETERIYRHSDSCCLVDKRIGRKIHMNKQGSESTVVWNPWEEKARQIPDIPDDGFRNMMCLAAANGVDEQVVCGPGEVVTLEMKIGLESI